MIKKLQKWLIGFLFEPEQVDLMVFGRRSGRSSLEETNSVDLTTVKIYYDARQYRSVIERDGNRVTLKFERVKKEKA